jgi:hypothetical protein
MDFALDVLRDTAPVGAILYGNTSLYCAELAAGTHDARDIRAWLSDLTTGRKGD